LELVEYREGEFVQGQQIVLDQVQHGGGCEWFGNAGAPE
jgi:hypothetical protein